MRMMPQRFGAFAAERLAARRQHAPIGLRRHVWPANMPPQALRLAGKRDYAAFNSPLRNFSPLTRGL